MQLYEVWFQVDYGNLVDVGRALVCAQDQAGAKEAVIGHLELPAAALTRCDVQRMKPNMFLLERKEVPKLAGAVAPAPDEDPKDNLTTQKGLRAWAQRLGEDKEYRREMTEYVAQQAWAREFHGRAEEIEFDCRVLAIVRATDEGTALRRLSGALRERSFGIVDESRSVRNVSVDLMPEFEVK
jgi:hypothetical protein